MKKSKILLVILLLLCATTIVVSAQTSDTSTSDGNIMDKILKWITGGGFVGLVVTILGFWKKGVLFISKIGGALFDVSGAIGDILVQSVEANTKIRGGLEKIKVYTSDGVLDKAELEDLIKEIESAVDEVEDVPESIKAFKATFSEVISRFKKS